jgi:uncharacterized 2Fe-2S/4Fe-4S cluster protein (DUF4445 family)
MSSLPRRHAVRFAGFGRHSRPEHDETLYQCARRAGVRIVGACGGRGVCGSCLVRVTRGTVDLLSPAAARDDGWVRACLARPASDCEIELAPRSLAPVVRAEVEGPEFTVAPDPAPRSPERAATEARLGLAVDLGTTNAAGFLVDLASGRRLASLGIENPQASYGADLVSRINHATRVQAGARELQAAALTAISALASDLCEAVGARTGDIAAVALCGNTAMHHLALGLPVAQLARAPFVPVTCGALELSAHELRLPGMPGARVHVLPNVGGFVGGDHVAALLATETRWSGATAIVMDIGTNTEVTLVHGGELTTVSCPSGPALEGGHIACGMRAAEGAIERVWVEDGRLRVATIGNATPVGLCGSGVIDAVAAMLEAGIINRRGRIQPGHDGVRVRESHREVVLAPDVVFGQGDVRAVQLAKAAIRAGIDVLLAERGIDAAALDRLLIAGAFGAYLNVASAIRIGMLPALPLARVEQVGNAAGVGVRAALVSAGTRARACALAARCHHLALGSQPGFHKTFMRSIGFD